MIKQNILILFGGQSPEHDVSITSAINIFQNIDKEKYNVFLVKILKNGSWELITCEMFNSSQIFENKKTESNEVFLISKNKRTLLINIFENKEITSIDCVIPVLHGKKGEDGKIQGMFDILNVKYVGNKLASSMLAMDKVLMKKILCFHNIKTAKYLYFYSFDDISYQECRKKLGDIMYIKPANSGSSLGISKVKNELEFGEALKYAFKFDQKILIEQGICGRELECGILGNFDQKKDILISEIGEINTSDNFYSYNKKYENDEAKLIIPAEISEKIKKQIKKLAKEIFCQFECSGLARMDFFLENDIIMLNEINTMPGFTKISMYPRLFLEVGVSYKELINRLIELA